MTEAAIYIVMRRDLNMPRGKEIAQACHAILALGAGENDKVVCVRAETSAHMGEMMKEASRAGIAHRMITDAGRTVFKGPTRTCAAIGPVTDEPLPLLRAARLY